MATGNCYVRTPRCLYCWKVDINKRLQRGLESGGLLEVRSAIAAECFSRVRYQVPAQLIEKCSSASFYIFACSRIRHYIAEAFSSSYFQLPRSLLGLGRCEGFLAACRSYKNNLQRGENPCCRQPAFRGEPSLAREEVCWERVVVLGLSFNLEEGLHAVKVQAFYLKKIC